MMITSKYISKIKVFTKRIYQKSRKESLIPLHSSEREFQKGSFLSKFGSQLEL